MTPEKLKKITETIKEVMMSSYDMDTGEFVNIIASLHNELYKEVTGEYYDYMFHWYNKATGGICDDDFFKHM